MYSSSAERRFGLLAGLTMAADDAVRRIQLRVADFFNLRDDAYIEKLFKKHADQMGVMMTVDSMHNALREVGIHLTQEEACFLFKTLDVDESGGLDLHEFIGALKCPCKVEQWTDSLPLSKLLAHCLSFKDSSDPLREISRLTSDELRASTDAYFENLQTILIQAVHDLKMCFDMMGDANEASSKFRASFKMSSGSVEDFHSGLHGRVGKSFIFMPSMLSISLPWGVRTGYSIHSLRRKIS